MSTGRSKYRWKDKVLYRALKDIDRSYYIVLVTCDDGRSGCLPLMVPVPGCTPPEDYVCCILSGYEWTIL